MRQIALIITAAVAVAYAAPSWSQGTKDNQSSNTRSGSTQRNGSSGSDAMGGAFKGTGTPTFGTSSGMGSEKKR